MNIRHGHSVEQRERNEGDRESEPDPRAVLTLVEEVRGDRAPGKEGCEESEPKPVDRRGVPEPPPGDGTRNQERNRSGDLGGGDGDPGLGNLHKPVPGEQEGNEEADDKQGCDPRR